MWATTFAFQPWHSAIELKRYMHRFIQEFPRINTLGGVRRTPYNQYDSIVLPADEMASRSWRAFRDGCRRSPIWDSNTVRPENALNA